MLVYTHGSRERWLVRAWQCKWTLCGLLSHQQMYTTTRRSRFQKTDGVMNYLPKQFLGPWLKGIKAAGCFGGESKKRSGLNCLTSAPQYSGFLCIDHIEMKMPQPSTKVIPEAGKIMILISIYLTEYTYKTLGIFLYEQLLWMPLWKNARYFYIWLAEILCWIYRNMGGYL